MTVIDRIMVNQDRHLGNCGFLRNVNTGEYIGPAPLFDFGNAYFPGTDVDRSKYFFTLESELAHNGRIKPIDLNQFEKMLDDAGIENKEEKEKLLKLMENNNRFIMNLMDNGRGNEKNHRQDPVINF